MEKNMGDEMETGMYRAYIGLYEVRVFLWVLDECYRVQKKC